MSLQIITGPTAEPVSVADVKTLLRLTGSTDDTMLAGHITVAREFAELHMRRSLAVKTYAAFFDRFPSPGEPIRVPAPPLLSVSAVKYLDNSLTAQTWDPSEYFVASMQSPGLIVPRPGFVYPSPVRVPGAVEVDFTAGYGSEGGPALPSFMYEGIARLAYHLYEHPEAVTGENLREAPIGLTKFFPKIWIF